MIGMALGSIVNIILDPVMILWMGMGVTGAAIATIIYNLSSMVYYTLYSRSSKSLLSVLPSDLKIEKNTLKNVFSIGIPQVIHSCCIRRSAASALAVIAPIFGVQYIILNNFQATGKSRPALIISVARQGVFFMLALFTGFYFFEVTGLVWAQSIADACVVVLSVVLYILHSIAVKPKELPLKQQRQLSFMRITAAVFVL